MKSKKMCLVWILLCSGLFFSPTTLSAQVATNNLTLTTERYLEAIETKAEFKARKEALEGEMLYLRIQNIALFLVVGYMAVNK